MYVIVCGRRGAGFAICLERSLAEFGWKRFAYLKEARQAGTSFAVEHNRPMSQAGG